MIYSIFKGISVSRYKIPLYPFLTVAGALVLLITGALPINEALSLFTSDTAVNPLRILILFFSMSALSVYLDEAGFFGYVAVKVMRFVKKKQIYLFLLLYFLVSVLTVFTSNDIVILTFTPFLCYFCKNAGISPIPYLFAEFVGANTFSMLLVIGNPTNIYLSLAAGIGFIEYFQAMLLPSLFGGVTALLLMLLIFSRQLKKEVSPKTEETEIDVCRAFIGGACLLFATVMLALSDFLPFEMWEIALFFASLVLICDLVYKIITKKKSGALNTVKRIPWTLLPFMLSMFVLVEALNYNGVCEWVSELLDGGNPIFTYGILSTLFANLVNNIPMSVFFSSVLGSGAPASAVYATVIGSNIGAYLTPIGALAGIMWMQILKEQGVKLSFGRFCFFGILISIPVLLASLLGLALTLGF
jgi:arsenical pump membrane protein